MGLKKYPEYENSMSVSPVLDGLINTYSSNSNSNSVRPGQYVVQGAWVPAKFEQLCLNDRHIIKAYHGGSSVFGKIPACPIYFPDSETSSFYTNVLEPEEVMTF